MKNTTAPNTRYSKLRGTPSPTIEEEIDAIEKQLSALDALTPLRNGLHLDEILDIRRGQLLLNEEVALAAGPTTQPTPQTATAPTSKLMFTPPPLPAPKPSTAPNNVLAAMSGSDAELWEYYQKADSHNCSLIDANAVACARVRAESRRRHSSDK